MGNRQVFELENQFWLPWLIMQDYLIDSGSLFSLILFGKVTTVRTNLPIEDCPKLLGSRKCFLPPLDLAILMLGDCTGASLPRRIAL